MRQVAGAPPASDGVAPETRESEGVCRCLARAGLLQAVPSSDTRGRFVLSKEGREVLRRRDERHNSSVVLYLAPEIGPLSKAVLYVPVPCNGRGGRSRIVYVRGELKVGLSPESALDAARPRKGETVLNSVAVL